MPDRPGGRAVTVEDAQALAKACGGHCRSQQYLHARAPLEWECSERHRWKASLAKVKYGCSWCPQCSKRKRTLSLEDVNAIAKSRRGHCRSKQYSNLYSPLEWECSQGHRWTSSLARVKYRGRWCPSCAARTFQVKRNIGMSDLHAIAEQKGGFCHSSEYRNAKTKIVWECSQGHIFHSTLNHIRSNDSWCPECSKAVWSAERRHRRLLFAKEVAQHHGGAC